MQMGVSALVHTIRSTIATIAVGSVDEHEMQCIATGL
jgi:hypothetical protein